jgi:hypothetical protein
MLARLDAEAATARQAHAARVAAALPAVTPIVTPVGIDGQVDALLAAISRPGPPWIFSLEGMGGLGKTTLAAALLAAAGRGSYFEEFAWASAQTQQLDPHGHGTVQERPGLTPAGLTPAGLVTALLEQLAPQEAVGLLGQPEAALGLLRTVLKRSPHLIVIDNLETAADVAALLPLLRTLVDPAKIVLTSRHKLVGETDIHLYPVPELSEAHALALVRQAGSRQEVASLRAAADADLRPIYVTVGGNPLALLLVVGQLRQRDDLAGLLADLHAARGAPVENLYTYLYRRAWDNLDAYARQVLLTMGAIKVGGDHMGFIAAISGLANGQVSDALQQLIVLNLVYPVGDVYARRYAIHSLTRSFLHEQVARWR